MGKITSSKEGATRGIISKPIMFGFAIPLAILFAMLALVIFYDSVADLFGHLLGTIGNKTKTIELIGWAIGGVIALALAFSQLVKMQIHAVNTMGKGTDSKKDDDMAGKWVMPWLLALLGALFTVLLGVMFFGDIALLTGHFLGTLSNESYKMDTVMLLGLAISGVFVAIGSAVLNQLAYAQTRAAQAQADAAKAQAESNRLVEKGHTQKLFKAATEHLGHANSSVRISAFYEFLHLMKNNVDYRENILDILYAHTRTMTIDFANRKDVKEAEKKGKQIKLTEEIQGLLDILFKSKDIDRSDIKPNLQRVCFSGADLADGDLSSADLRKSNLSGSSLFGANLFKANLAGADLTEANLFKANLSGADLTEADLSEANLSEANLSEANLFEADLTGTLLFRVNLSGANLSEANLFATYLSGVNLSRVNLSGANLSKANLSKANLSEADLSGADLSGANFLEINLSKADLSGTNLSRVDLSGVDLSRVDLSEANLFGADLSGADLSGAKLLEAKLLGINLSKADLPGADLSGADLSKADLSEADLSGADLSEANLSGADLPRADLSEADLSEANLSGADLSGADLSGADLSGADLYEEDLYGIKILRTQFGSASYTNKTQFPEWFVPPIVAPDNGDKVRFSEDFVMDDPPEDFIIRTGD